MLYYSVFRGVCTVLRNFNLDIPIRNHITASWHRGHSVCRQPDWLRVPRPATSTLTPSQIHAYSIYHTTRSESKSYRENYLRWLYTKSIIESVHCRQIYITFLNQFRSRQRNKCQTIDPTKLTSFILPTHLYAHVNYPPPHNSQQKEKVRNYVVHPRTHCKKQKRH